MPGPSCRMRRLVNKADFERLLATRSLSRSAHFALHHVTGGPQAAPNHSRPVRGPELSTATDHEDAVPVDDLPPAFWVGAVVPKRHARRAVTRSLLKRQVHGAFERHAARLPAGLWLVRLRAPFAPAQFVSARSQALALAARAELDALLGRMKP